MTPLEQSIRTKIGEFTAKEISLEVLHDWLAPIMWDIRKKDDPEAAELIYSAELYIAEYSAGHLPKDDLRSELDTLLHD